MKALIFLKLDELESEEQEIYVKKAINSLPEIEGVIVTLYYMEDCSVKEISEVTNLSESNIKVKLYRARKELKKLLESLLQQELKPMING